MLIIKNGGLNQYGAGPFSQQQFGTAGVEGVNVFFPINCIAVGFYRCRWRSVLCEDNEYIVYLD